MKVELKVVSGSRAGMSIPITGAQFMIGRAEDCQLKPRSELISRYHCALLTEASYVAVRDLGSKNGVYVNGERIGVEQELKNGDRLAIGPLEFEIAITANDPVADLVARVVASDSISPVKAAPAQPTPAAPAQPAPAAPAQPAPVKPAKPSAPASNNPEDLADWLLGDDDDGSDETQTIQTALDDLDLPYTPQEPKEEKPEEKKPASGPNSSDAAANLLKNFFKGGR